MDNTAHTKANAIDELLDNVRFLKKEIIKKLVLVEGFSKPELATYGMNSFHMSVADSYRY